MYVFTNIHSNEHTCMSDYHSCPNWSTVSMHVCFYAKTSCMFFFPGQIPLLKTLILERPSLLIFRDTNIWGKRDFSAVILVNVPPYFFCNLWMHLFQFSLMKSPSMVTMFIKDIGKSGLLDRWYCFWEFFSETVASNKCFSCSFFFFLFCLTCPIFIFLIFFLPHSW